MKTGQVWTIKGLSNAHCVISQIDKEEGILHVSVRFVDSEDEILHMPFSIASFLDSIKECVGNELVTKDHEEAIGIWKDENGGVWSIPISEAVNITMKV